jgi:magnesium transporter
VGIDPAIAGGVLLVAATDILGFLIFLGLASALLL